MRVGGHSRQRHPLSFFLWATALSAALSGTGEALLGSGQTTAQPRAADQAGLAPQLSAALRRKSASAGGSASASLAAVIPLDATSMSDTLAAHPACAGRLAERADGPARWPCRSASPGPTVTT